MRLRLEEAIFSGGFFVKYLSSIHKYVNSFHTTMLISLPAKVELNKHGHVVIEKDVIVNIAIILDES